MLWYCGLKPSFINLPCDLLLVQSCMHVCMCVSQECFNCPYSAKLFAQYAEEIPGPTSTALSAVAKECNIYIIGGNNLFVTKNCNFKD